MYSWKRSDKSINKMLMYSSISDILIDTEQPFHFYHDRWSEEHWLSFHTGACQWAEISGSKWASCCVGSRKNGMIWVSLTRAWVRTSPKLPQKVAWWRTTADIGAGHPRLIDVCDEQRLVCVVRSHRRATVARIAEKVATMGIWASELDHGAIEDHLIF